MRMHFNTDEEMFLVKKVTPCKAHVTAFGSVQKKFEMAEDAINAHPSFRFKVKGRSVKETINKLVINFKI